MVVLFVIQKKCVAKLNQNLAFKKEKTFTVFVNIFITAKINIFVPFLS